MKTQAPTNKIKVEGQPYPSPRDTVTTEGDE